MIFMNLYISSVQDDGFADSRAYLSLKLKFVPQEPMVEAGGGSPVLRMEDFKKKELKELEFLPWGQGRWIQHDTARKFMRWLLCVCLKLRGIRDVLNGSKWLRLGACQGLSQTSMCIQSAWIKGIFYSKTMVSTVDVLFQCWD